MLIFNSFRLLVWIVVRALSDLFGAEYARILTLIFLSLKRA